MRSWSKSFANAVLTVTLGGVALATTDPAQAALVYSGNISTANGELGDALNILSLRTPRHSSQESGSIGIIGGAEGCQGDIHGSCGSSNSPLPLLTFSQANIIDPADLVIALDAREPGNDNAITLESLLLTIYGPAGDNGIMFQTAYTGPSLTLTTCPEDDSACLHVFSLDGSDLDAVRTIFDPESRIGLSARLSGAAGGPDRWLLSAREDAALLSPQPISEPGITALLAVAFGSLLLVGRRPPE